MISRAAKAFAVLAFLLALAAPLAAQDLAAWFAKAANQAAYGAIAAEAQTLAIALRAASLSDSLLAARLEEAARKRVPAPLLLATLKEDTARYPLRFRRPPRSRPSSRRRQKGFRHG